MNTGYRVREGSQILAERRAENIRREETKRAEIRAGYARWLGRRYAIRGRM